MLNNPGFVVGYSEFRRNPLWVSYRLSAPTVGLRARPREFRADWRTLARVGAADFRHSGFDRGHLAPNYAIARMHGREAQLASFLMSNITPQSRRLNQKLWQRLEELEFDVFAPRYGQLWVTAGPIFDADRRWLKSGVEIPDAFFRVWLTEIEGRPQVLAFLTPQQVRGTEPLTDFVVSVDEIERRAGLDLFHRLGDDIEAELEAAINAPFWDLARYAEHPPRY